MKYLIITILASLIAVSAAAQTAETTTPVTADKLNFEQPRFLVRNYFEGVKAHLSAEGRKEWKPELSLRANAMLLDCSVMLTGGIRTSQKKVFGIGAGWGQNFLILGPVNGTVTGQRVNFFLYHRHYIPLGHRKNFSLYSDIMLGARRVYALSDWYMENGYQRTSTSEPEWPILPGDWRVWFSWEPGIAFHLWGKSNFFIGPSIGPTIGLHAGIAL
ncbi:MAG: hypothetical protein E7113_04340 [Bacteroidales bacterium]|nr:hypothetical protein [Bacteroidales bacterium]